MDRDNAYLIKDLYVAAYLYASDLRLIGTQKESDRKIWFVFVDKEACEEQIRQFYAKEAVIDPKKYADALRSLKNMLFM